MTQVTLIATHQNFDAVNSYIDHLTSRNRSIIEMQKANTLAIYLKWLAVLVVAVGAAVALMMWAYRSGNEKPDPIIVEPRIVQAPDVRITIDKDALGTGPQSQTQPDPQVTSAVQGAKSRIEEIEPGGTVIIDSKSVQQSASAVVDFVIFRKVPFGRGLINEVVVGMHYPDSSAKAPDRQWCYVSTPDEGGVEIQVNLAGRNFSQEFLNPITVEMAKRAKVSTNELRDAQLLCKFEQS